VDGSLALLDDAGTGWPRGGQMVLDIDGRYGSARDGKPPQEVWLSPYGIIAALINGVGLVLISS